jgi:uncharacterized protein (TIGR00369 family)
MAQLLIPDPELFEPLPPHRAERWEKFGAWDEVYFPNYVGLELEEARLDYARMRLPYRSELNQPAGVVHGGAISTLIDTVVVPAIGGAYDDFMVMLTLSMNIQFVGGAREQDLIAHGWITRRGKRVIFCEAVVVNADGDPVATGSLVYTVRPPT